MSANKIVSIATHPKFRDVSALRRFLDGEDVCSVGELDSDDWKMLTELQQWADGLMKLDSTLVQYEEALRGGIKKSDFYSLGALPDVILPGPAPLHHMSRNMERNTIHLTNEYKYRHMPETPHDDDA